MHSKFVGYVLLVLMLMISVANAAHQFFSVGSHEVEFNASLPEGIIKYWPMFKSGSISPGEYYTSYETWLARSYNDSPFLIVEVRDFENSIHGDARTSEFDTLRRFYGEMVKNFTSKTKGGEEDPPVAFFTPNYEGQYVGVIMMWPSNQIEVLIIGTLPNLKSWKDIVRSVEFDGRILDYSKGLQKDFPV